MRIRLHLVRFMYINLILSCCFWLYDNAAAADGNAATLQMDTLVADRPEYYKETYTEAPSTIITTATTTTAAAAAAGKTSTPTDPEVDNIIALGAAPTSSAKTTTKATTTTNANSNSRRKTTAGGVKDTSVNNVANELPANVVNSNNNKNNHNLNNNNNNQNNNEDISVVPESERGDNDANDKHPSPAKVPNNELNNNNNNQINRNAEINQVVQLKQNADDNDVENVIEIPKIITEQQQQQQHENGFSDIITELPTITVTELPLQLDKDSLETVLLQDVSHQSGNMSVKPQQPPPPQQEQREEPLLSAKELMQKDDVNDPGGGQELLPTAADTNLTMDVSGGGVGGGAVATDSSELAAGSNETANEEVSMPVFSEWAQKQMEAEASREQAMELEQQVVNNSAQRKNATGGGSNKLTSLKLRAKNYASPDCGAKIIASNADATNTGAVLSHSSDEYMLSTCGSRIWFVVELCEAVQAQKVELANFELFSSSPRNFTVAVSKRFPTRDWSNVGRFAAEDKRTVQTFELHPHLFGKFVRVDILSHYSKEHFCPISLFRVFGTSEYEAFETEIRHSDELDDFDDDFAGQEQAAKTQTGGNGNIFQSASDAVMNMVKKAAQVLVKPTKALRWSTESTLCHTPTIGTFSCKSCNSTVVERINNLLSCQSQQLQLLLSLPQLRAHLLQTDVCQSDYHISLGRAEALAKSSGMGKQQSFFLSILPAEHVGAMCKLLQAEHSFSTVQSTEKPLEPEQPPQQQQQQVNVVPTAKDNVTAEQSSLESSGEIAASGSGEAVPVPEPTTAAETSSSAEIPVATDASSASSSSREQTQSVDAGIVTATPADVNIFNVQPNEANEATTPSPSVTLPAPPLQAAAPEDVDEEAAMLSTTMIPPSTDSELLGSGSGMVDDSNLSNWENIDNLLTTTVASITAGGGAAAAAAAVVNGNSQLTGAAASNVNVANGGSAATAATGATGGGVNLQPKLTQGAQSESVFIRLSNRIKALERNMSLSGQYLEELSRRYKKQVEELQQTLTQQTLTVRTLEEQSRRQLEQEQLYRHQSAELAGEVRSLTYQVQACILVIIIVGTCIFLMLVLGTVYYRKLRRQTQQLLTQPAMVAGTVAVSKQKLSRRKSYEQLGEQTATGKRRPSEEAMIILNGCGDVETTTMAALEQKDDDNSNASRQRKLSVCYGSNNNIAANLSSGRTSLHRRKGVKHSSLDSTKVIPCSEQLDKFFDVDTLRSNKAQQKPVKKKSLQELKRQESAPANCLPNGNGQAEESAQSDFDEALILDDDDLCNFIPNSDLAYNEFMPDGPSGYQIVDAVDGKIDKSSQGNAKKSRRVSSPAFFKSPFGKSKNKGGNLSGGSGGGAGSGRGIKGSQSAHEATSWEWYRLKRNDKQSKSTTVPAVSTSVSTNASADSTSLSEINFPYNSTQNSFRILEEAILSSEQSKINGKGCPAASSSSSSGSGASTTSSNSTTKKKQRAFNNLLRKVF